MAHERTQGAGQVVVIGLDGATWDLIDPWIEQGRLPTLARLAAHGTRAVLRSTMPPVSPLAWSSFLTGTNPGKHGIYGFIKRMEGEYRWRPVAAPDRGGRPLWSYTDADGLRSAFLYVPLTFPPSPLDGVMISGLGTPGLESDFVYPPDLKPRLTGRFEARHLVEPMISGRPERILSDILASVEVQTDLLQVLLAEEKCALTVFVFGQTDRVQHFFWKEMDPSHPAHDPAAPEPLRQAIPHVYERIDAAIARIWASLDETATLIVMSDHGFGPYHRELYLNNWLARERFLAYHDSTAGGAGSGLSRRVNQAIYRVIGLLEGRVPQKLVWPLRKRGFLSRLDQLNASPSTAEIDWARTRVYSADFWGNIYLNLRGREPAGIVEPGREAEELLQEVTDRLCNLTDAETGEAIVQHVHRGSELYHGPYAQQSPDLIVECYPHYFCKPQPLGEHDRIVMPAGKYKHVKLAHSAEHRQDGILLLAGPGIREGHRLARADIADLAPTILYLLGRPLSRTFDGTPLLDAVRQERRYEPIWMAPESGAGAAAEQDGRLGPSARHGEAYSTEETRAVEDRLRGLGYI